MRTAPRFAIGRILRRVVLYAVIPAALLIQLFILLPVPSRFSWHWLGLFALLFAALVGLVWLQTRYFTRPTWERLNNRQRTAWAASAGGLALLLLLSAAPSKTQVMERLPFLAPVETLELRPVLGENSTGVDIWKVKVGEARLSTNEIVLEGEWRAEGDHLRTSDPEALLTVTARVPRAFSVVFMRAPDAGQVMVRWDGKEQTIDLRGDLGEEAQIEFRFNPAKRETPPLAMLLRLLTLPGWAALALWATGVFFYRR